MRDTKQGQVFMTAGTQDSLQRAGIPEGRFSHNVQFFCTSQPLHSSQLYEVSLFSLALKSKAQMRCARIKRIFRHARLRPKHLSRPRENGLKADATTHDWVGTQSDWMYDLELR